ncbi:MAG: outer membrane lipoprotein-sorting protein [Chromatiaceae bacterium]|nr:outer membrane lipoprotein-sorting protein [Gammaproteobacteria bacterium]MCP5300791.1 outer membrane lipoprotein-sorting protein [Chromatiaceae bacterium]MCP5422863.1 outer membrane lipoprotein-sorting protein [Chromatiaceae bacterium]
MQSLIRVSLIPLLVLCLTGATFADEAGTKLAQAVYDAPDGDDFASRATMTLLEKGRDPRVREMYTMAAQRGPGERWSLTRFTSPADIAGVGLLTKDYPGDENDQWLYLPALDRVRRVSSNRKGGRFVGSDLFFEDLRDREIDMDTHRLIGEEKIGSLLCKVLESVPKDPDNSVYSKRISWVHPGTLVVLRADLYQAHSKSPVKRLTVKRIKKIQGYWTVLDSTMEDLESQHSTQISLAEVKYNQGIPDQLFTSQSLSDANADVRYRP